MPPILPHLICPSCSVGASGSHTSSPVDRTATCGLRCTLWGVSCQSFCIAKKCATERRANAWSDSTATCGLQRTLQARLLCCGQMGRACGRLRATLTAQLQHSCCPVGAVPLTARWRHPRSPGCRPQRRRCGAPPEGPLRLPPCHCPPVAVKRRGGEKGSSSSSSEIAIKRQLCGAACMQLHSGAAAAHAQMQVQQPSQAATNEGTSSAHLPHVVARRHRNLDANALGAVGPSTQELSVLDLHHCRGGMFGCSL